jgi:hypothetical protein
MLNPPRRVIAESKDKLIIVDDEIIREYVYLISTTKVDHYGDQMQLKAK